MQKDFKKRRNKTKQNTYSYEATYAIGKRKETRKITTLKIELDARTKCSLFQTVGRVWKSLSS